MKIALLLGLISLPLFAADDSPGERMRTNMLKFAESKSDCPPKELMELQFMAAGKEPTEADLKGPELDKLRAMTPAQRKAAAVAAIKAAPVEQWAKQGLMRSTMNIQSRLRSLSSMLGWEATDLGGAFPPSLDTHPQAEAAKRLAKIEDWVHGDREIHYVPGRQRGRDDEKVLLWVEFSAPNDPTGGFVCLVNGTIKDVPQKEFQELLKQLKPTDKK
jgi:hypothetical protein